MASPEVPPGRTKQWRRVLLSGAGRVHAADLLAVQGGCVQGRLLRLGTLQLSLASSAVVELIGVVVTAGRGERFVMSLCQCVWQLSGQVKETAGDTCCADWSA